MGIKLQFGESSAKINIGFEKTNSVADVESASAVYIKGDDGATFTPHVSEDGVISWTNDQKLPNPAPVNIKGPKGDPGDGGTGDSFLLCFVGADTGGKQFKCTAFKSF